MVLVELIKKTPQNTGAVKTHMVLPSKNNILGLIAIIGTLSIAAKISSYLF